MEHSQRSTTLKGSWEWLRFAAQLPSRAIPFTNQAAPFLGFGGRCIVTGLSWNNTATTAGRVDILDGVDGNGGIAWRAPAVATALGSAAIPPNGIMLEIGCWLNLNSVTLTGALLVIPLWHYDWTPPGE